MEDRSAWFDACIIGAVFATILIPASASLGFFSFLLNIICIAMLVVPMVVGDRDNELAA